MLEKLDLHLIYSLAREAGYSTCHLYAEHTATTEFELCDKENRTRHFESGGISIELKKENSETLYTFRTYQFSTEAILKLLGFAVPLEKTDLVHKTSTPKLPLLGKKLQNLNLLIRKINLENSLTKPVSFWFQEKRRKYQSSNDPNEIRSGEIEQGEIKLEIESSYKGKPLNFSYHFSKGNLEELWNELHNILPQIQRRIKLGSTDQWPAPQGPLPVGWSSRSIAKLVDCFIRGFEGDLVLKDFSYLPQLKLPLNFNFSLREKEPLSKESIDHEGSTRKPMIIFDGKKPKGLATDQIVAKELSVAPTGHSRRESFEAPSTISFWHPLMESSSRVNSVLSQMAEGLWVEEIEIKELDLLSSRATIYFSQVNLVHQGEIGESVEPFSWTLSLIELMGTLTHFSNDTSTTGLFHTKQKQRILTEYTTPDALSAEIFIPGSVPKGHYW